MTENLDTAKAKLTIISQTLSPEEISCRLGLPWDDVRRKGDRKGKTNQFWDVNVWNLYETSDGNNDALSVEVALDRCLRLLRERVSTAIPLIQTLSRTERIELGLYMLTKSVPSIHLDADTLTFIHKLGAELDVDVVLYADSSE